MSRRGKRGVSKGSREYEGAVYKIEFRNKLPCGENRHRFMNDFNRLCEKHLNYWEEWKIVKGEPYDHVWLKIKELWNIPDEDDDAKKVLRKKANETHRRFKSKLTKQFVEKKNNDPKARYSVVDMRRWDEFVVSRESEEFKLKSAKAKASALQNTNPSRLGRTCFADMEGTWRMEWDQLVLQHPWLSVIQNDRSKIYALAHLPKNKTLGTRQLTESMEGTLRQLAQKEQDMLENGTYHILGRDPITEVFGKEHGGRTKGVSTVLGVRVALGWLKGDRERHHVVDIEAIEEKVTKTVTSALQDKLDLQAKEIEALKAIVAHIPRTESPTCLGSSCVSDGFDDLEVPTPCDLLWPYPASECCRVAIGKVYPTRGATPHGSSMSEGYIKVQVDMVEEAFKAIPVPKATEKVHHLEDSVLEFIEWPREKIKIHQTTSPRHTMSRSSPSPTMPCQTPISDLSSSSCYRPQMEEDEEEDLITFQHQMPSGGYMSLLKKVALHPQSGYPPTSWPEMVEQTMPSHSAASERVKPKQTQEERVQERIDKLKDRPKAFKDSLRRFMKCKNQNISIVAPQEMYAKPWEEWIEYEAIVDLHVEGKVDISFIHWWAMHLHSIVKGLRENRCTFLNPHLISSTECLRNGKQVVNHILDTKRLNPGKEIYVAPYLKGERHWLLFVVCPNLRMGYIVDSAKEDNEKNYYFPEIVERAFEIKFDWMMTKCFQQKGRWECGYYLMKFMHDLVVKKQADFPKSLWNDTRCLQPREIDQVAFLTLNEFYRDVVLTPLDTTAPQ